MTGKKELLEAAPAKFPTNLTPTRLLALVVLWIFLAEVGEMFLLTYLEYFSPGVEAFVDGVALLLCISPCYFLLYRPLKQYWLEKQDSEREVRFLSQKLLTTAETERTRLTQDLHDQFGQVLTSIQFKLQLLQDNLQRDPEEASRSCQEVVRQVAVLGNQVRAIAATLRPAALDQLGLVPALRLHVGELSNLRPDICMTVEIAGQKRSLPGDAETGLFRICQESLHNVIRHSQATEVRIELTFSPRQVMLTVADNGIGFDIKTQARHHECHSGIGLIGMRERMALLGGRLTVQSQQGLGTTVRAVLPVSMEKA
jgi:signal transduction histidine kinase